MSLFNTSPIGINDYDEESNDDRVLLNLLKSLLNREKAATQKRGLKLKVYYQAIVNDDGSVVLIPKDQNKGHYLIGR